MKHLRALLIMLTFGAFIALPAAPAQAHTPYFSGDCGGVRLVAVNYDPAKANRWSVTINGVTQSGTFGQSFDQKFPVPQDGTSFTWSASIVGADGEYPGSDGGTFGPCGSAEGPTSTPTTTPTTSPTTTPTTPTQAPTATPTTPAPTQTPAPTPTASPTQTPAPSPSQAPTQTSTPSPSQAPTQAPADDDDDQGVGGISESSNNAPSVANAPAEQSSVPVPSAVAAGADNAGASGLWSSHSPWALLLVVLGLALAYGSWLTRRA